MSELPEGWLTGGEADELRRLAAGNVVLELGAWKGRSTVAMAETASLVVSVDRHQPFTHFGADYPDDTLQVYLDAVRGLPNVVPVIGEFDVARLFWRDAFGLVFVDGLHDYDNVRNDLSVATGFDGPVALHDWGRYEVEAAARSAPYNFGDPDRLVDSLAVFL